MMKRSQRMKPVLAVAQRSEDVTLQAYGRCQQQLADAEHKLRQLTDYQQEYAAGLQVVSSRLVDLAQLQARRHFMTKLQGAIAAQQAEILRCQQVVAQARLAWLKTRSHSQSMNKLTERYQQEEGQQRERQAQRQSDELSGQRVTWLRQANQSNDAQDDWSAGVAS